MKTLCDNFIITADATANQQLSVKGIDGKNLYMNTDFRKYELAVQNGIVEIVPYGFSERYRYDFEILPGDKVYVHHFVVQEDNKRYVNKKKMYVCEYSQIFCIVRNKKIIPIEDWMFTVPKMESEESCKTAGGIWLKLAPEPMKNLAVVKYVNQDSAQRGINVGDIVYYMTDGDYEIEVEGEKLYRMKNNMMIAKFTEKGIEPFDDCFILEIDTNPGEVVTQSGIIIPNLGPQRQQEGTIYGIGSKCKIDYLPGEPYLYFTGQGTKILFEGKLYLVLRERDLLLDSRMYKEIKAYVK